MVMTALEATKASSLRTNKKMAVPVDSQKAVWASPAVMDASPTITKTCKSGDASVAAWRRAGRALGREDEQMAAPLAAQKAVEASPEAVDTGAPSWSDNNKMLVLMTAHKAVEASPAAVGIGAPLVRTDEKEGDEDDDENDDEKTPDLSWIDPL
jgi:hypothetical protein